MKILKLLFCLSFLALGPSLVSAQFLLYGTTWTDYYNAGTVFKCTPSGNITNVMTFDTIGTLTNPWGSLLLSSDSNFYGTTYYGGAYGHGGLFRLTQSGKYTPLVSFNGTSMGGNQQAPLIQGFDGNLYGTLSAYGSGHSGTLYKCTTSGGFTVLVNFNDTNGNQPLGVIQASDSNLYGITCHGGLYNYGTLYRCTTSGTLTTLINFDTVKGTSPQTTLLQANDGNLYGATTAGGSHGGGTIFKCTLSGVLTTIANLDTGEAIGYVLIQATDGNIYGLTFQGGLYNLGTIFRCTLSGTYTTLYSLNGHDGSFPDCGLLQASDNNFYGLTAGGGVYGYGTLFQYTLSGMFTKLADFDDNVIGEDPRSVLVEVKSNTEGINELKNHIGNMNVYPNPFTDATTIAVNTNGKHYLELDDITGRKLRYIEFTGNEYLLSAEGLAKGLYFVRVYDNENNVIGTTKIVVQ